MMKTIENEIFYHIHNPKIGYQWHKGDKRIIGKEINFYTKHLRDISRQIEDGGGNRMYVANFSSAMLNKIRQAKPTPFLFQELMTVSHELRKSLGLYLEYTREMVFENVRREKFPDYPSRYTALFVIPDYEKTKRDMKFYWKTFLGKINNERRDVGKERYILKLKLTGKIHNSSALLLQNDTFSINKLRDIAFDYWRGKSGKRLIKLQGAPYYPDKDIPEYLFEGKAEVLEVLSPREFGLNS